MNKPLYVYKSMRVVSNYRQQAIFIVIISTLISLFVSRAALSITMCALVALACIHKDFPRQFKRFISHPLLLALSALFFIPLISGLWSEDVKEWANVLRLKLPLLFFPLAFAGNWQLTKHHWKLVATVFVLLVFAGSCWSTWQYFIDPHYANDQYLKAKLFATPLNDDHIRFSWLVSTAILAITVLWSQTEKKYRWMLVFIATWLIVYLHMLAARTGLFSFYIILGYYLARQLFLKRSLKATTGLLAMLVILPLLAWLFIPSFQNRIRYFRYDFSYVRKAMYLPGANDGNRFLSIRGGLSIMEKNPFGVGAGDVENAIFKWYDANVPGMLPTDKLYPSSEWLIYGMIAGWPGMICFTAIMLIPLFIKTLSNRLAWVILNSTAAFSFMFDVGLEVQYGIFIYVLIVLWWWKWFDSN
jgi:O-antigen ligase